MRDWFHGDEDSNHGLLRYVTLISTRRHNPEGRDFVSLISWLVSLLIS